MDDLNKEIMKLRLDPVSVGFSIKKVVSDGVWFQSIFYENIGKQALVMNRSKMDIGGTPIGSWSDKADAQLLQDILYEVENSGILEMDDLPILPGQEYVSWEICAGDQAFKLVMPNDIIIPMDSMPGKLSKLSMILMSIANDLRNKKAGAALECLLLEENIEGTAHYSVGVKNVGEVLCVINNPMIGSWDKYNYLSIEVGIENEFGGVSFVPVELSINDDLCKEAEFLDLSPGEEIYFPVAARVDMPEKAYVRSVYSQYNSKPQIVNEKGAIYVLGRAFSKEKVI